MSNPNDYVTHAELDAKDYVTRPEVNELVSAFGVMMKEMLEQSENRIRMYIEAGVQKQADLQGEMLARLLERQDATEAHLGALTENMEEVKIRLGGVENRLEGVENRLEGVENRLDRVENRLDRVENRLDRVENRLDRVEKRLSNVEKDVKELKADMKEVKATVSEHDDEIITLRRVK